MISRRALLWGSASLVAATGGYQLIRWFENVPEDIERIPPELRKAALDIHVHVLGIGTNGTGCWMNEDMNFRINTRAILWNLRLHMGQEDLDQAYIRYLLERIRRAGFLRQVVLLAQDWSYTGQGKRDEVHTPFYTPNDYIARLAQEHNEFLFGASIHPYRTDALDELDRVAETGAVLIKWNPGVQGINLEDRRCRQFYRRLVAHRLPLLSHVGEEQSIPAEQQEYGDPRKLVAPLEEGVTVIAAHVASLGDTEGRPNFEWLSDMLVKWPNLYADTSSLTLYTRWRVLLQLVERTDLHDRLVHGSDFPLPPASTVFFGRLQPKHWWNAWRRENTLRRDFEIKRGIGLPDDIFIRGYKILAPRLQYSRHRQFQDI